MSNQNLPIACDLSRLTDDQRRREQELLGKLKTRLVRESDTDDGVWFSLAADPATLAELGELLALERLCCPFLTFRLEVTREESCRLHISGPAGAKDFVLTEFTEKQGSATVDDVLTMVTKPQGFGTVEADVPDIAPARKRER